MMDKDTWIDGFVNGFFQARKVQKDFRQHAKADAVRTVAEIIWIELNAKSKEPWGDSNGT